MNMNRIELFPGVFLRTLQTNKFKSAYFSLTMLEPITAQNASLNALVPDVLRRGCEGYPDMEAISGALDALYGGAISPNVRKKGETQCIGFGVSVLDDRFAPDQSAVLEPAAALLGQMLTHPVTENGVFRTDYVESEKQNLIDEIRGQINDKRSYATQRMLTLMCEHEAYGVSSMGTEETATAITPTALWERYQSLLKNAQIEIFYCGSADHHRVETALRTSLADLPVNENRTEIGCDVRISVGEEPRLIEEAMDVTQGKLTMGFRTGGITIQDEEYPALVMMNAIFGGTAMSKLFMHVRERLSLCYYASSGVEAIKGVMMVSSGVEFDKYQTAKDEIFAQLEHIRCGEIEEWEMEGARRILVGGIQSSTDSQGGQDEFWLSQAVAGTDTTQQLRIDQLEAVTLEQVVAVSQKIQLDTVYFLKGLEV